MMKGYGLPKFSINITFMSWYTLIIMINLLASQREYVESKSSRLQKRFTQEDICKETLKTVKPVDSCPTDKESTQKRSAELKCNEVHDSCTSEDIVYHCVRSGSDILEVCAPRYYIIGKYCVHFDDGIGRVVEDYTVPCPECPFRHYSNESINYATCFDVIKMLSATKSSTSMPSDEFISTSMISIKSTSETTDGRNKDINRTRDCRNATGRRKRHSECNQLKDSTTERYDEYMKSNETTVYEETGERFWDSNAVISFIATLVVMVIVGSFAVLVYCILRGFLESIPYLLKMCDNSSYIYKKEHIDQTHSTGFTET